MRPLRFGLIGLGHFGNHYLRLLQEIPGVALVAVASRSAESFVVYRDRLPPSIERTTNTGSLFSRPDIDCVVIVTPPSTHASLVVQALAVGKHVLVEKPMVISVQEAEQIKNVLAQSNRTVMVGFPLVYNHYIQALKNRIAELGRILYVLGEHCYYGPIRSDVGCFMDASIHELSVLEYLFAPGAVTAVTGTSRHFGASSYEDFSAATVTFSNGLTAHFVTSWYAPEKVRRLTVVGETGMAVFDDIAAEHKLRLYHRRYPQKFAGAPGASYFPPDASAVPEVIERNTGEPLRYELEHFIECVRTGAAPLTDFDFGYRVTEQCEKILAGILYAP